MNTIIKTLIVTSISVVIMGCSNKYKIHGSPIVQIIDDIPINETWAKNINLSWNDEFNGNSLDTSKWEAPNNIERQGASHWMSNQVSVNKGILRLGITYSEKEFSHDPGVMKENYDCGVVRTKKAWTTGEELFTQKYGYFETRAKLPKNISADYWAAFWMLSGDFSDK